MTAVGTAITMAAERRGAAARDRHSTLWCCQVQCDCVPGKLPGKANDVGHLQGGPIHRSVSLSCRAKRESVQRTGVALRCRWERCR